MTAGNKRIISVPVFFSPLEEKENRFPAACQRSQPSECTQPCLLDPFIHHEVLERRHFVRCAGVWPGGAT